MPTFAIFRQLSSAKTLKRVALTGAVLLIAALFFRAYLGPRVATDLIEPRDFIQTVVASGHVESPHRVDLGTQITGTVKRVPVLEGQTVRQGQTLIELENAELLAGLKQAALSVIQAEAKMRQLKEVQLPVLAQARQQALATQISTHNALLRAQELFVKGFIGQAALDEAQRMAVVAQSQVISLQEQLGSLQSGGSDVWLAQTNLAQAQASVELATSRLQYAQIKAPVSGTLISRNVEPGDGVQPGKILMVLSPVGDTELVVQIDEKHLSQLKIGQNAVVSADAYSAQKFNAVLSFINPGVDAQRGSVTVKLTVLEPPSYLQQDMTVSLNIETARRTQVMMIATDAVHSPNKLPWVMLVRDGRTVKQDIEWGLRGSLWSEVVRGLKPGDRVVRDVLWTQEDARVRLK